MKIEWLDRLGCFFLSAIAVLFRRLSSQAALRLGASLGACACFFSSRRFHAYADLKAALGDERSAKELRRIVREHYRQIGRSAAEILRFPLLDRRKVERDVTIHHLERFESVAKGRKGGLLLTAHLGNWELIQIVAGILGYPIHALMRKQRYSRLDDLLNELRRVKGSQVSATGMGIRQLLRALRRGELVGILGDQSAGRDEGVIIPFFGRKTTVPTGAFELAGKTGVPLLPAFIARRQNDKHDIFVGEPIDCSGGNKEPEAFRKPVSKYLREVEGLVRQYPDQWLWAKKRWKYSWTQRLLILSDGKPGHVKQSKAIAEAFYSIQEQYGRPGMEYPTKVLEVRFRSGFRKRLFFALAPFLIPWAQGRLRLLRPFLEPASAEEIEGATGDFVISAGSGLIPLNLCLARENMAKSIVVMRPPFPYSFCRYDLAVIPVHDRGRMPRGKVLRNRLTLSSARDEKVKEAMDELKKDMMESGGKRVSVFLGGPSKAYEMQTEKVKRLLKVLGEEAEGEMEYLVTTSRRTPQGIKEFLKEEGRRRPGCCKVIIDGENSREGTAEAMLYLADTIIVTEDSISMISEAAGTGKPVIVVRCGNTEKLSAKHRRFLSQLEKEKIVLSTEVSGLAEALGRGTGARDGEPAVSEPARLREMVKGLL